MQQKLSKNLRRVSVLMKANDGIPGNYEEFSYQDAKKVQQEIIRKQSHIKAKMKIEIGRLMGYDRQATAMESQLDKQELDEIFMLDLVESEKATSRVTSDFHVSDDELMENVEYGYEDDRKNYENEDARIA